jgi:glycosyltransferase involved in cell wall biosynthesis
MKGFVARTTGWSLTVIDDALAVVLGTYNRRRWLERAVASIRVAAEDTTTYAFVVDGGSTDGSQEWLSSQPNVVLIEEDPPLQGAVHAFNLGFGAACDAGFGWIANFNDDAEYATSGMLTQAISILKAQPKAGAVAFEFNLRGPWQLEFVHGKPYPNFGVTRRDAGMAVARAQGDRSGRAWWNPMYHTYGADTEFGCWLWKLDRPVLCGRGLRVLDGNVQDALRMRNDARHGPKNDHADSQLFWSRWPTAEHLKP